LKRPLHFNISEKTALIDQHIELADMITDVMNDQVNVLEILVKVFERSVPHPRENKYKYQDEIHDEDDEPQNTTPQHDNVVRIPVISECEEQMPHVMKILDRELIRMKKVTREHEGRTANLRDSYHQVCTIVDCG
jgi:hypothetical protein